MRRLTTLCLAIAAVWFSSRDARAAVITLEPVSQTVALGDPATIDFIISDLGAFSAPSVATFDIDVGFDTSLVSPATVDFGTELDRLGLGTIQSTGPGFSLDLNVFELSLDPPPLFDLFQPDTFKLFSITFDTLAVGTTSVSIALNALGDAYGEPLSAELGGARITIEGPTTSMPAPATLLLVATGMLAMAARRRHWG